MNDLFLGIAIMLAISIACTALGALIGRRLNRLAGTVCVLALVTAMVIYTFGLQDHVWFASVLPYSNLPVTGNWLPPMAGLLLGLAWPLMPGGRLRKEIMLFPLGGLGLYSVYGHLFMRPPHCGRGVWEPRDKPRICQQTSPTTCGPSAAATLLKYYGIDAAENEMAILCLTRDKGTSMHGLYRGLKLKTAGTSWDVRPVHGDKQTLRSACAVGPVLISVCLERGAHISPEFVKDRGWSVGVGHTVVVMEFSPIGEAKVADPASGTIETWTPAELDLLWHGAGLQIIHRP